MKRGRILQTERTACAQAQGSMQLGLFLDVKEGPVMGAGPGRVIRDEPRRWARLCWWFSGSTHFPWISLLCTVPSWPLWSSSPAFSYVKLRTWPFRFLSAVQKKVQTCYSHFLVTVSPSCYSPVSLLSLKVSSSQTGSLLLLPKSQWITSSFSLSFHDALVF